MSYSSILLCMLQIVLLRQGNSSFIPNRRVVFSPRLLATMLPAKKESPSAERNKHPIWDVLQTKVFPQTTHSEPLRILEIAAGAGSTYMEPW